MRVLILHLQQRGGNALFGGKTGVALNDFKNPFFQILRAHT
jgi:hypothetical protein